MSLRPRPEILEIEPYSPGVSKLPGANRVVKLSSNEGAFGPPPGALRAMEAATHAFHRYPDGGAARLREAIGARFGLDPARIVCGAGSDDLIYLLCHIYGGAGTELIMTEHGFSIYDIAGRLAGCRVVKAPERNLTADVDAILAAVSPATRMVFLANPNNPTGTFLPTSEVTRLRAALPPDVLLVLDAAYAEYVDRPDYDPGIALVEAGDNTVMTRTFSKMFGMGGLRLGWAYAPPEVVDLLHRARYPFNVSMAAHEAGIAALAEPGWVETSRTHNKAERARLTEQLQAAGIFVHPSETNFVLADFRTPEMADKADHYLRSHGLIVRRVGGYGLPHCLRITVGLANENDLVIDALRDFAAANRA
ncbi:MAG TPA: histidinol-phosphate transaminase [Acetobacteraceae bacterium]|nr:histidinol-phosphate transaminase [Acetobacteraceae bacterium]